MEALTQAMNVLSRFLVHQGGQDRSTETNQDHEATQAFEQLNESLPHSLKHSMDLLKRKKSHHG